MIKLAGLKRRKDSLQVGLIGFFQLLAACTLSADMWQAILLVLLIPGTTALLFWNYAARVQRRSQRESALAGSFFEAVACGFKSSSLPLNVALTVIVFILFPRLTFNVRVPGFGAGQSAYTDQMNLEQTGSVARDSSIAAWMGFTDDNQRGHWNQYLRGDILDSFTGKEWVNSHQEKTRALQPDGNGVFKKRKIPEGIQPLHITLTLSTRQKTRCSHRAHRSRSTRLCRSLNSPMPEIFIGSRRCSIPFSIKFWSFPMNDKTLRLFHPSMCTYRWAD